MSLLVVMAHYDVDRVLRKHTLSSIENYAGEADRIVVVSTSGVRPDDVALLPPGVDFVTRPNYGYDFFSYKWGLDIVGDYASFDRIVITNDTFVGPIVPLSEVVGSDRAAEYDLMGMTWSENHGGHAQSFFVTVNGPVARSRGFRAFWRDMAPVSDRRAVIQKYEVGLTMAARDSGFRAGAYFLPTASEQALAIARFQNQFAVRLLEGTGGKVINDVRAVPSQRLRWFNPAIALADRLMLNRRLPLLKFDTLRFDPYGLNAERLLREAEAAYPGEMAGVRSFLSETRSSYPYRLKEHNLLADHAMLERSGLGYCADSEFAHSGSLGVSAE
jgi:rhamnosyltransferase